MPEKNSPRDWEGFVAGFTEMIDRLMSEHSDTLVQLLYRVDVPEEKVRRALEANKDKPSAGIIALLIIERQLEKMDSKKQPRPRNDIPEDERW